jgi:hypothetical protein
VELHTVRVKICPVKHFLFQQTSSIPGQIVEKEEPELW